MGYQSSSNPVDKFRSGQNGHNGQNGFNGKNGRIQQSNHKHFNQSQQHVKFPNLQQHQQLQHQQRFTPLQIQLKTQMQQQRSPPTLTQNMQSAEKVSKSSNITKPTKEMFDQQIVAQYMQWKTATRAGPGLFNHGNTCFLNSTIQCLLHTPPLAQVLVKESKLALRGLDSGSMLSMYQR